MTRPAYLYRGVSRGYLEREFSDRVVVGETYTDLVLEFDGEPPEEGMQKGVADLPFTDSRRVNGPVTGGFSDELFATAQFSGSENFTLVLDGGGISAQPVKYTADQYHRIPGLYAHVAAAGQGALRVDSDRPGLGTEVVGLYEYRPGDELPTVVGWVPQTGVGVGADGDTSFTSENEYIVRDEMVSLPGTVTAVLAWKDASGLVEPEEDLQRLHADLGRSVPRSVPFWLLAVDTSAVQSRGGGVFEVGDIEAAHGPEGLVPPAQVPNWARGVNG